MRKSRLWRGLRVDGGLETIWLERMNGIRDIGIEGSCAGHGRIPPALWYSAPDGVRALLLALAHLGDIARVEWFYNSPSQPWLIGLKKPPRGGGFRALSKPQWWRRILGWLERWYGRKGSPAGMSLRATSSRHWPGGPVRRMQKAPSGGKAT
jgi:hypothetical protein